MQNGHTQGTPWGTYLRINKIAADSVFDFKILGPDNPFDLIIDSGDDRRID
jgi:hypothetical protein